MVRLLDTKLQYDYENISKISEKNETVEMYVTTKKSNYF